MLKNAMKSTSVVALCTALMTPPVLAQNADENLEECGVTGPFPCVLEDGTKIENAMELASETLMPGNDEGEEQAETAPQAPETPAEPETPADPNAPGEKVAEDTPAADAQGEADAQVEATVDAETDDSGVVEDVAEGTMEAGEQAGEAMAETAEDASEAAEDTTQAAEQTAEDAGEMAEEQAAEAGDAAEETGNAVSDAVSDTVEAGREAVEDLADAVTGGDDAEAEATAEAEAEAEADAEATAEAETDAQAESETTAEADAEAEAEAETDATAQADADTEATSDEDELADALEEAEGDASAEATAEANAEAEAGDEEMTAGERIEENTDAETAQAPSAPEEPMEDEAPEAAAAAEGDGDTTVEEDMASDEDVVVEEVTEETARSSNEEFETEATVTEEASAQTNNTGNQNNSGLNRDLTDFEKLVLAGLGGVAVGTILANGKEIVSNSGDRIVVQREDGTYEVLKNDDQILRQPGVVVSTKNYDDGSTRTVVERQNGVRIVTIRAADGTVLKRTRVLQNGDRYVLFDDTQQAQPVSQEDVADYEPIDDIRTSTSDERALRQALMASMDRDPGRSYSLRQVRQFSGVRDLAPVIEVDAITFDTGSSTIRAGQAEELSALGQAIREVIEERPGAVFLIEGHTDAVGGAAYNLALSDRRAESVALALTEYFDVPPENMITQGYGESELKIVTSDAERANRRANVRNITPLLQ
ncbi:OmpA family protein [Maritimibacter sp. UBA3975]|mgnify:CR=1 FL=1|uniref:OmpA family protein n=1 Tax=Maritimibacter sp. UBA3975 TaxID=1946833 RepID=UPI000C0934F8|nr:OmpA family protein [Maritimibacter sp. UBA3975]MAM61232.1 hypothetical protein [Maritimibacter sp.]|tara:strand:- start:12128 stop:14257 length:2130 start_codon:yes stop_codon:yes gene_type:complete